MTAITRSPQNTNYLQPTKFELIFARLPNTTFFCQSVEIPSISIGEITRPTPFADLHSPGNNLTYSPLTLDFLVDEELRTWQEIHDWMRGMGKPTTFDEYRNLNALSRVSAQSPFPQFSDAELSIHTALNNPKLKFKFHECFPTDLSAINFSTTENADTIITSSLTLRYSWFDIIRPT
jgi:hypothetical protein